MFRIRKPVRAPIFLAVLVLAACDPGAGPTGPEAARAPAPTRDPILFVHGWQGSASTWSTMVSRFKADGWTDAQLMAFSYNSSQSNATTAQEISTRVDQLMAATGATRVDIVTHSMGGLSSRYYAKNLGGDARIDAWVSLGGPNHGTAAAWLCFSAACREMRPGSAFLAALNAGAAFPPGVRAATWGSPCDEAVEPAESTALEGAANHRTGCLSHMALLRDTAVYRGVRDFVAGPHRRPRGDSVQPGGAR